VLPKIDPIRPEKRHAVPTGPGWVYELKLDGFRGVLSVENGRGSFTSKTGKKMPRFAELAHSLARSFSVRDVILDGEIIVLGEAGPDFYALMQRRGVVQYAAFDLLWLNGQDLREQPLWRRKKRLRTLLRHSPVGLVDWVEDPKLFDVTVQKDLEGIVAKRKHDPYAPETIWVKVKHTGYSQMEDRWELFDKRR
jgi:bifunctional non-homologous end joining protein LigD